MAIRRRTQEESTRLTNGVATQKRKTISPTIFVPTQTQVTNNFVQNVGATNALQDSTSATVPLQIKTPTNDLIDVVAGNQTLTDTPISQAAEAFETGAVLAADTGIDAKFSDKEKITSTVSE